MMQLEKSSSIILHTFYHVQSIHVLLHCKHVHVTFDYVRILKHFHHLSCSKINSRGKINCIEMEYSFTLHDLSWRNEATQYKFTIWHVNLCKCIFVIDLVTTWPTTLIFGGDAGGSPLVLIH